MPRRIEVYCATSHRKNCGCPRKYILKDAKANRTIRITEKFIREGVPESPNACTLAQQLVLSGAHEAWVFKEFSVFGIDAHHGERFKNSRELVKNVIVPLDDKRRSDCKPGVYTLYSPKKWNALNSPDKAEATKRYEKNRKRREKRDYSKEPDRKPRPRVYARHNYCDVNTIPK